MFLEETLGYARLDVPANVPYESVWLDLGGGQQLHLVFVAGFAVSPFENEFGRHLAVFHPLDDFAALKGRLQARGAAVFAPLRATSYERFFFKEPINGYVFEVIDAAAQAPRASHLDQ